MPELPEVEMARRHLEATSLRQTIREAEVKDIRILSEVSMQELEEALVGRQFCSALRHGKRLFLGLFNRLYLTLHLGLTGWPVYLKPGAEMPRHTRLLIFFDHGSCLALEDPRIFGEVGLTESPQAFLAGRRIGPDALQLDPAGFLRIMSGRRGLIKPALLNQSLVAGLGNLYADEALFQAGISPRARHLDDGHLEVLFSSIQEVLRTSIANNADFEKLPRSYLLPHRRKGGSCPRDGTLLCREKIGGRTSYYCPEHQKTGI
jgi:formamidopyrimidine-DNA glycosylase